MGEQTRQRVTKFGRKPKDENLTHQLRLFMAQPVKDWLRDEATRRMADARSVPVEKLPRPASPAPLIRELIERADWRGAGADVEHDRRPSLLMLVSELTWNALVAQLAAHPQLEDLSTLVYAYAVLPAAIAAGVVIPSDITE